MNEPSRVHDEKRRRNPSLRFAIPILALLVVQAASACHPSTASSSGRGLVVKNPVGNRPTFFDFGDLQYGQHVEHVFEVENTDPDPVTIADMLPSCGCTAARIVYTDAAGNEVMGSIAPGQKVITLPPGTVAHLSMTVDTTHVETMNIDKLTQVRLRSDSKNTPYLTLEMHLVVRRTFRSVPDRIDLGESPQSSPKSGRADLTPELATARARIRAIEKIEGPFDATVDKTEINGVDLWVLAASPKPELPIGPVHGRVTLSTTRDDGTGEGLPFSVPLSAQIARDVVVRPFLFALRSSSPADDSKPSETLSAEAELAALIPGERVLVRSVSAKGSGADALRFESSAVQPEASGRSANWRIVVRAPASLAAKEAGGIVAIELDHPRVPRIEVPYTLPSVAPKHKP
jgi:hypothetical protein